MGRKNGAALEQVIPRFKNKRDVSLVEGMKVLMPIYKVIGKSRQYEISQIKSV